MSAAVLVLYGIALAASIASLCINWSTSRKLRRVEESMDTLEDAVLKLEERRSLRPTRPDPGRNYR